MLERSGNSMLTQFYLYPKFIVTIVKYIDRKLKYAQFKLDDD